VKDVAKILVVDDHPSNVKVLRVRLEAEGHEVLEALNGIDALEIVTRQKPDLVLLDLMMPGMDGYEVCRRIKEQKGTDFVPVIMVTARTETEAIVRGLEQGADEYITKPFEPLELMARVKSMLRIRQMYLENTYLRQEIVHKHRFDNVIGQSPAMEKLYQILPKVIDSDVTVLLSGESGTGKEAIARCIHYNGPCQQQRFVTVNCGALSEGLLESELFGHKKGAFTGATEDRKGLFEAADGGTLFLDEIGETSPGMQVKLLRALQEGEITRVGETDPRKVKVRLIAATNRDLQEEVKTGNFREDLYYRLTVFPIALPSLRERRDDIPLLASHFIEQRAEAAGQSPAGFTPEAMDALSRYDWPGNVRELQNEVERGMVLNPDGGPIGLDALSEKIRPAEPTARSWRREGKLKDVISEVEREMIQAAFESCDGNKTRMSEQLGISRWTLLQKMKEFGTE
jgi:DNA-binding NtrC family response regulator